MGTGCRTVLRDSVIKHIVFNDTVIVYNKPQTGGGNVLNADSKLVQAGRLLKEGTIFPKAKAIL